MEKEKKVKVNDNGSTTIIETIETTPDDGFVHSSVTNPVRMEHYGKDI